MLSSPGPALFQATKQSSISEAADANQRLAGADHGSGGDIDLEPVERRPDVSWRDPVGLGVVEINVKVGEHRFSWFEPVHVLERLRKAQMARVRRGPQGVEDP